MESSKHKITEDMLDSLAGMIKNGDKGDLDLGIDILEQRDITDKTSEANFKSLMGMIVSEDKLFPKREMWVIKAGGRILDVDKVVFKTRKKAEEFLSRHLTDWIGTNSQKLTGWRASGDSLLRYTQLIKKMFKGGLEMRNFLVKNNIVEIVRID